jgi:hypothetical protein
MWGVATSRIAIRGVRLNTHAVKPSVETPFLIEHLMHLSIERFAAAWSSLLTLFSVAFCSTLSSYPDQDSRSIPLVEGATAVSEEGEVAFSE